MRGLSNAEVARRPALTAEKAESHVSFVLTELDPRDRTDVVIPAYGSWCVTARTHTEHSP